MFDLTGMTALVTGASGGIGSSIARALAAQGARLALSGSNAAKLRAFRDELNADFAASNSPPARTTVTTSPTRSSSKDRT